MTDSDLDLLVEQLTPELPDLERLVRAAEPRLTDSEVLDRALQKGLAELRRDLSRKTFEFLKAKLQALMEDVARAREMAATVRFASAKARRERERRRAAWGLNTIDAECSLGAHTFHDVDGNCWAVHEVDTRAASWSRGRSCLIFSSELGIRRVWEFPVDWNRLSDAELEGLSWMV